MQNFYFLNSAILHQTDKLMRLFKGGSQNRSFSPLNIAAGKLNIYTEDFSKESSKIHSPEKHLLTIFTNLAYAKF